MKRKSWTGPEVKRLERLSKDGCHIDLACEELGRGFGSVKRKCEDMGISLKGMYSRVGARKDWNDVYNRGTKAKTRAECPYSRTDLYHFCAWMAGYNDRSLGYGC